MIRISIGHHNYQELFLLHHDQQSFVVFVVKLFSSIAWQASLLCIDDRLLDMVALYENENYKNLLQGIKIIMSKIVTNPSQLIFQRSSYMTVLDFYLKLDPNNRLSVETL